MPEFINGMIVVQAVFLSFCLDVEREFFGLSNFCIWLVLFRTTNGLCCCYMTYKSNAWEICFLCFL